MDLELSLSTVGRSLISAMNSTGPSTDPWGNPGLIGINEEWVTLKRQSYPSVNAGQPLYPAQPMPWCQPLPSHQHSICQSAPFFQPLLIPSIKLSNAPVHQQCLLPPSLTIPHPPLNSTPFINPPLRVNPFLPSSLPNINPPLSPPPPHWLTP